MQLYTLLILTRLGALHSRTGTLQNDIKNSKITPYDLFDVRYLDLTFFEILNLGMYVIYNLNVEDNLAKTLVLFSDLRFVINECR